MAKAGYSVDTQGAVALSAGVAKTVLFVVSGASFGMDWKKYRISFDGVTASAVPVLIELNYNTAATNSTAGTGNTSQTANISQNYGRVIATGCTAGSACTSEPTVQTNIDAYLLTPNGGTIVYDWPLGDVPDSAVSQGFCIRLNAPAVVNARATMWWERM